MPISRLLLAIAFAGMSTLSAGAEAPDPKPEGDTKEVGGTGFQTDAVARAAELLKQGQAEEAEKLLVRYLIVRPDDNQAAMLLKSARIAMLEGQIRELLKEQAETKELIVGDPDYEAARARTDKAVQNRLDVVEYFVAQNRYLEAVNACNAILNDYPLNPAVMQLKMKLLKALEKKVYDERDVLLEDQKESHAEGANDALRDMAFPRKKAKVARDIMIFDEDIAEAERAKLREKFNEKIDLTVESEEVRKVVERLFAIAGINYMILDSTIGSELVTIHMEQQSIQNALTALTRQVPISFNYSGGMVYIAKSASTAGEVMVTEIIRIDSGLTDVLKPPQLDQQQAQQGGQGGQQVPGPNGLMGPIPLPQPQQQQPQQQQQQTSDLEKFLDEVPTLMEWPAGSETYLDRKSNTVFVRSTPAAVSELKRLLRALDYNSVQVLIETRFLEVTEQAAQELGLNWSTAYQHTDKLQATGTMNSTSASSSALSGSSGLVSRVIGDNFGNAPSFDVTLSALEKAGKADTLSEPKILTLNNATGVISIEQEISYLSGYQNLAVPVPINATGNGTPTINQQNALTPQYTKVPETIKLSITPSVARNSDVITLTLNPVVRQLTRPPVRESFGVPSGNATPIQQPIDQPPLFDTRQLSTCLHIKNGQTVALGGLVKEKDFNDRAGLPWLSRIPGFGLLFGRKSHSTDRRNLIILVTAHIVDPTGAQAGDEIRRLRDTAQVVLPEGTRAEIDKKQADDAAAQAKAEKEAADAKTAKTGNQWGKGR